MTITHPIPARPLSATHASASASASRGDNGQFLTRSHLIAADTFAALLALVAASTLWSPGADGGPAIAAFAVALVLWFANGRLYRSRVITRRAEEVRRIVDAGLRAAATVGLAAYLFGLAVDRTWLLGATVATIAALTAEREVVRRAFTARRIAGRAVRRVLLIGDNAESRRFAEMFETEPALGYTVAGSIDPSLVEGPTGLTDAVFTAARSLDASGVVVAATAVDTATSNRLVRDLVEAGIHVELTSTLADIAADRLTVRPLGRFPVVYVEPRLRGGWRAIAKRLFDVVLASLALVVLAPLMAAIALLVRFDSAGPVLFRQERLGRDGAPFDVLKFRTMVVDAEELLDELVDDNEGAGPLFKMRRDPRVTKVGHVLRKTSLDELPQLWNVVRNEMSLVGPRPALASETDAWDDELWGRLRVKPGITGMWQVSGRSSTTFEEYTRLDLYYVDNWSLVVDLAILLKTVPAVLRTDGAY